MHKKITKLLILLFTILMTMMIATKVKAAPAVSWYEVIGPVFGPYFRVQEVNNEWIFCMGHNIPWIASYDTTEGREGMATNPVCSEHKTLGDIASQLGHLTGSIKRLGNTLEYSLAGPIFSAEHQDVAYILAKEEGNYDINTNIAIWTTDINEGDYPESSRRNPENIALENEAKAFKAFYNTIHSNGTDIFESLMSNNTNRNNIKVAVNADKSYTVGPFNFSYANGIYDGTNKFSWVENVVAVTDAGETPAQVITSTGKVLTKEEIGREGTESLNGVDFYIRFTNLNAKQVSVRMELAYLESCYAEMYKYKGTIYEWSWQKFEAGWCPESHLHISETPREGWDQQKIVEADGSYHFIWTKDIPHIMTQWRMCKEVAGDGQPKLHVIVSLRYNEYTEQQESKYGHFLYKRTNMQMDPIPLTMDLSGKVFLDKDTGKANTGNEALDEGEELAGVEVRLYNAAGAQISITQTNENGEYLFTGVKALDKYYVRFTYNGMLYTNVAYKTIGDNTSKATEQGQGNDNNRRDFNNKFGEIGSFPGNYKTKDCITGAEITNRTYYQEEIASLFKEISEAVVRNGGNEVAAYQQIIQKYQANDAEIKQKVQFVADCRISAYTVQQYPLLDAFVIDYTWRYMAGVNYNPIYAGTYSQRNINLGIKARTTFDMAVYKDVLKADVVINGKTETYEYDSRKGGSNGFRLGVSEADYLNGLRGAYQAQTEYTNETKTKDIETDTYDLNLRTEEVANGQSSNYNAGTTGKIDGNYQLNNDYENLKPDGESKDDRLKIFVTYKVAIRNQSSTVGAITELVDYYDKNYTFSDAYVGDADGNKTGDVTKYDTSLYGNEYKSVKNTYETIYLRPNVETKLDESEEQYIYVVLQLVGPTGDVGTLLSNKLLNNQTLTTMNLVEMNGYKTYHSKQDNETPGLIDIDSIPGNLNISNIDELTQENIINYPNIVDMYEDDSNRAPALIYKLDGSRTMEGTVFEDATGKDSKVYTGSDRTGNGKLDNSDKKIAGVLVELVEIKNGKMTVRSTTKTNGEGWYGFTGFLPGNYTVRYTYGLDDETAMAKSSTWYKGVNDTSYNGQDYQSTIFGIKQGVELTAQTYKTDATLIERYTTNHSNKTGEETTVPITESSVINKYNGGYWYTTADELSDAKDDEYRKMQVIDYSKAEYGTEIVNHKAEVFNAYVNPQPSHITQEDNRSLANELERRTYRYAYTPEMEIEVEYARKTITGNKKYEHKITGVDFGIVERPKAELTIDQDVKNIKVTAADGSTLFDTQTGTNNLQWIAKGDITKYDKNELINIIMDEELINGAKLEVIYNITVTNNSEKDIDATARAKTILNYVSNKLNFEEVDNKDENGNALWQVVSRDSVQRAANATFVNNKDGENDLKLLDLSTQAVILKTTDANPLAKTNLQPGEQVTTTLTLKKVLSAESSSDDLSYTNLSEIVEIDSTVGRYDHGAIPGNQSLELQPQEHDASGASQYASMEGSPLDPEYRPQDGTIIITPPTGSVYIYYVIGFISTILLAAGIYFIQKFVVKRK